MSRVTKSPWPTKLYMAASPYCSAGICGARPALGGMETGEPDNWLPAFMQPIVWGTDLQLSEHFPKAGKCRTDVRK